MYVDYITKCIIILKVIKKQLGVELNGRYFPGKVSKYKVQLQGQRTPVQLRKLQKSLRN
jgi:hypothetical protein